MVDKRNIVLITLDSLRADHCSFTGYHRKTTPTLDKMARKGVVFENAIAPAPRTLPSMAQIFTGKLMTIYNTSQQGNVGIRENARLHLRSFETISERLSAKGYTTGAFTPNAYTTRYFGFGKGFSYYQDFLEGNNFYLRFFDKFMESNRVIFKYLRAIRNLILKQEVFKPWESYYSDILSWVERAKQPFFLWIFLLETHLPYLAPKKFKKWGSYIRMYYDNLKLFSVIGKYNPSVSSKFRKEIINAYDDSIYYADSFFKRLTKDLSDYDPIYIIHADHGEEFGERGFYGHYHPRFYEENIHVPWIINNVDRKEAVEKPISLLNLPKIILNLATDNSFSSLDTILSKDNLIISKDFDYINKKYVIALRMGDLKFISGQKNEDELYNLKDDPDEQENLVDKHPELAEEMKRIVERHIMQKVEKVRIYRIGKKLRGVL